MADSLIVVRRSPHHPVRAHEPDDCCTNCHRALPAEPVTGLHADPANVTPTPDDSHYRPCVDYYSTSHHAFLFPVPSVVEHLGGNSLGFDPLQCTWIAVEGAAQRGPTPGAHIDPLSIFCLDEPVVRDTHATGAREPPNTHILPCRVILHILPGGKPQFYVALSLQCHDSPPPPSIVNPLRWKGTKTATRSILLRCLPPAKRVVSFRQMKTIHSRTSLGFFILVGRWEQRIEECPGSPVWIERSLCYLYLTFFMASA